MMLLPLQTQEICYTQKVKPPGCSWQRTGRQERRTSLGNAAQVVTILPEKQELYLSLTKLTSVASRARQA